MTNVIQNTCKNCERLISFHVIGWPLRGNDTNNFIVGMVERGMRLIYMDITSRSTRSPSLVISETCAWSQTELRRDGFLDGVNA